MFHDLEYKFHDLQHKFHVLQHKFHVLEDKMEQGRRKTPQPSQATGTGMHRIEKVSLG